MSLLKPISYEGVAAFVQQSGLKVPHIGELFDKYLQLDTDENDEIGLDGVFALLAGVFAQYEEHFCTAIFNFLDQNAGARGRVHPAKVVCAVNLLCKGAPEDKARVFFSSFDADNSESLDRNEFGEKKKKKLIFSPCHLNFFFFVCVSSTG
jgi:Ca2+-binding EF-hand superfamily protein